MNDGPSGPCLFTMAPHGAILFSQGSCAVGKPAANCEPGGSPSRVSGCVMTPDQSKGGC